MPPLAVKVWVAPEQSDGAAGVITAVGERITFTVDVAVAVHPLAAVTVTV